MILCCGEALIDMLPRVSTQDEQAFAPYAGGAVFNTAIALGRLGAPAGYFGGLSSDLFGQLLQDTLAASKVDVQYCPRSNRPTTLAFVTLVDGHAKYAFYDEGTAGRMLAQDDLPELPDSVEACFFGGISLVSEPAADSYAVLCARESASRVIMIDPNIRPGFIQDEERYRNRLGAMLAKADIIKVSDEDLEWIGDSPEGLVAGGAKLVLITKGAEGIDAYTRWGRFSVPAHKATVVDTVGAGDTFNAGLLAGLARDGLLTKDALTDASEQDLTPAIDLGARAAAITVSRAGANPPWANEL
ncbi:carbohydrate kinase family protein [Pseudoprimorskyibacter insulae]|uniref:Fructokinase n=1 Tax=Pseudoprimorskyibacter insulae TaxID=1695997 RepID=A0A2R8AV45_9RHOB|nr:carbohydrate kinase [Pseudoprimorskyibacter insulae]SPF79913.1 Fructokinase [Pseudoprimorskyibacter insulae]